MTARSASVGIPPNTSSGERNIEACADSSPCRRQSVNCAESIDTWLTIRSAITSTVGAEFGHVGPRAEARVDTGVVDRVEAGVAAVDRDVERQHVHAAERARQLAGQERIGGRPGRRRGGPRTR